MESFESSSLLNLEKKLYTIHIFFLNIIRYKCIQVCTSKYAFRIEIVASELFSRIFKMFVLASLKACQKTLKKTSGFRTCKTLSMSHCGFKHRYNYILYIACNLRRSCLRCYLSGFNQTLPTRYWLSRATGSVGL